MHLLCVGAPPLLFPWDTEGTMKIPNETPRSFRREGVFPWLVVRNAISFPNFFSMEDAETYSVQVEPWKMASDREVLSPDAFNKARDFCSLHGTSAWSGGDHRIIEPQERFEWWVRKVGNQREPLSVSWTEHRKNNIFLMMLPQGIRVWQL